MTMADCPGCRRACQNTLDRAICRHGSTGFFLLLRQSGA
ncbi:hypothetical protein NY78_3634 [Desulfovibrio sp. TomC]|nr:hypothetical protein NY78_3634 [Desulfovibrio sp. TomC]